MIKKYWAELFFIGISTVGVLLYAFGIDEVIRLTPLYLLFNMVLLWFRWQKEKDLWKIWGISAAIGYLAELIGVRTGLLFGEYIYGDVLGPKLFDVPLMVGVMWALVMSVLLSLIPASFGKKRPIVIGLGAVAYDFTLEHFATRFNLWRWSSSIPVSNAVGWLVVSMLIAVVVGRQKLYIPANYMSKITLIVHTLFFLLLLLL